MPITSPGNDDDTGENHQPTLRKNTAEPVEQTLKQNTLMRLEPETLMAYEDRWAVDLARSIGRKGMDRIAGLTGWRGPRPWTMDPAMTDTGEAHTLEGMWPEPGPGVDDEWRADLDHDDGAGPRAVGMDRIIEGIWAEDHRGRNGADHGWWSLDEGARP